MKTADGTRRRHRQGDRQRAAPTTATRSGYILTGPEFLTVFDGQTGAAMATTNYVPPRGTVSSWGDNYGNRVDRFLAGVAYLDGQRPEPRHGPRLLHARRARRLGLARRPAHAALDVRQQHAGNGAYAGQGNHNLTVADVDGDGKDEIIYGAATIDDNGAGLCTTGSATATRCTSRHGSRAAPGSRCSRSTRARSAARRRAAATPRPAHDPVRSTRPRRQKAPAAASPSTSTRLPRLRVLGRRPT